jgi:hypothetical protein
MNCSINRSFNKAVATRVALPQTRGQRQVSSLVQAVVLAVLLRARICAFLPGANPGRTFPPALDMCSGHLDSRNENRYSLLL